MTEKMKTDPNQSAHPVLNPKVQNNLGNTYEYETIGGLTKREYFAGLAMSGIISDKTFVRPNEGSEIARCAVQMADALILELNK